MGSASGAVGVSTAGCVIVAVAERVSAASVAVTVPSIGTDPLVNVAVDVRVSAASVAVTVAVIGAGPKNSSRSSCDAVLPSVHAALPPSGLTV